MFKAFCDGTQLSVNYMGPFLVPPSPLKNEPQLIPTMVSKMSRKVTNKCTTKSTPQVMAKVIGNDKSTPKVITTIIGRWLKSTPTSDGKSHGKATHIDPQVDGNSNRKVVKIVTKSDAKSHRNIIIVKPRHMTTRGPLDLTPKYNINCSSTNTTRRRDKERKRHSSNPNFKQKVEPNQGHMIKQETSCVAGSYETKTGEYTAPAGIKTFGVLF